MERITLRLTSDLDRALDARAKRDRKPAAQVAKEALRIHLDRCSLADIYGDRFLLVIDQKFQRLADTTADLAKENARLQRLMLDLFKRIESNEEPQPEPRAHDPRADRLLENLIPGKKGNRS